MGGSVSSGRDNAELVDNLKSSKFIRSPQVEAVFRAVDRGEYMPQCVRNIAYKDLAWREGQLHLSAPCIYSEVMEGLELREGLTFLNIGSGTGYLSTMAGLLLGSNGINHGIEIHPNVVLYANKKLADFVVKTTSVDEFDFCPPKFINGNGLCLPPDTMKYDRLYCGASCPTQYFNYCKNLINVGGLLVMPIGDHLLQVRRVGEAEWTQRSLLNVSFAPLLVPGNDSVRPMRLSVTPQPLQQLARAVVRRCVRSGVMAAHPELRELPKRVVPPKKSCPRRICIPIEDDSDVEMNELNQLHDVEDREGGAAEMNALLSLVLSMSHSRAAGAIRIDSDSDRSTGDSFCSSSSNTDQSTTSETVRPTEEDEAASTTGKLSSLTDKQSSSTDMQSTSTDKLSTSTDKLSTSTDKLSTSTEQHSACTEKHSTSTDEQFTSIDKASDSIEKHTCTENQSMSTDKHEMNTDKASNIADKSSCSTDNGSSSIEKAPSFTEIGLSSIDNTSSSTDKASSSTDKPSSSTEEASRPDGAQSTPATRGDSGGGEGSPPNEESESSGSLLLFPPYPFERQSIESCRRARCCSKRSKLDSGLGADSSPRADRAGASDSDEDYRKRRSESTSSSSSSAAASPPRRHRKRRAPPDAHRLRRERLAALMAAALASLRLPRPLRVYLNLDRPLPAHPAHPAHAAP